MTKRLPGWAIVAGGTAMATAAFFASANITHWVMGLHQTEVVVRPGPTVYLTGPAGHGHTPPCGRCLPRHLPGPPPVVASRHGRMPTPGRTIEEGSHKDQDQAQRIITASKAWATVAATDITDWLACSVQSATELPDLRAHRSAGTEPLRACIRRDCARSR